MFWLQDYSWRTAFEKNLSGNLQKPKDRHMYQYDINKQMYLRGFVTFNDQNKLQSEKLFNFWNNNSTLILI